MSHLHSVRVPATVIFAALLVMILVSASRTTYRLSPVPALSNSAGYALAGCDSHPVTLAPLRAEATTPTPLRPEPRHACPWPGRPGHHHWASAVAPDPPPRPAGDPE
jgi:hypothetical protein